MTDRDWKIAYRTLQCVQRMFEGQHSRKGAYQDIAREIRRLSLEAEAKGIRL